MTDPEPSLASAWVFVDAAVLPDGWRGRSRTVALVALLPSEVASLLRTERVHPAVTPDEARFLGLVAAGHAGSYIARQLRLSDRTVFRRLAKWRDHFGVDSTAELAAELSKRGF